MAGRASRCRWILAFDQQLGVNGSSLFGRRRQWSEVAAREGGSFGGYGGSSLSGSMGMVSPSSGTSRFSFDEALPADSGFWGTSTSSSDVNGAVALSAGASEGEATGAGLDDSSGVFADFSVATPGRLVASCAVATWQMAAKRIREE